MKHAKILIADDEAAITTGLSAILEDAGYSVDVVSDGQKALDALSAERYGVVLADLKMPKLDGLTLLGELQQRQIPTECIIITGQATVDSAVQAMQQGAYDYIEKPLNAEKLNRLKALIPKALDKYQVQQTNRELASKLEGLTHYGELTGQSESMRSVYQVIEAVAPSTASVLILGESGTGKELVARALHAKSDRAKGPFFALNCAALPKEILENELFGHEKGAFTGSINEKQGAFEMSSGGTIFLDEMAEMPPDIQVKLLRALETKADPPARRQEGDQRRHPHPRGDEQEPPEGASPTASCARISTTASRWSRSICRRCASAPTTSSCSPTSSSGASRSRTARRSRASRTRRGSGS